MNIIYTILLLLVSFISISYITYIRYKNRFVYMKINEDDSIDYTKTKYNDFVLCEKDAFAEQKSCVNE